MEKQENILEIENLRRKLRQLERDNRMLTIMNENAEKLRRSYEAEKRLQYLYSDLLLKSCPNMLFLFNEQLRLVNCSAACGSLVCEKEKADLVNRPFEEVFSDVVDDEWVEKVFQQNKEVLNTLIPYSYDDSILFTDDDFIHVQVAISPIVDENGQCRGTVMSVNDITELSHAKQKAEDAARSKSSFLANMSHEIRTPMNAVKGLSELLALTELNSLQRNYVGNIISSSNSLLGIINDVLDFSKIDANRIEFIEGPYNLAELITGVCNVVNIRAEDKNLLMFIDADPDLPSRLIGDDVRIKQIITNVLSNAVKYTNEGFVCLRIRMDKRKDSDYLLIEVEDTGIGIKEEDTALLFNAFSRVDLRLNRSVTGTGLGLAISKQLAVAMGGDIEVTSVYGEGSLFRINIPQKIADTSPLAHVDKADEKKFLLLGCGKRQDNILGQLSALGIFAHCAADGKDLADLDLCSYSHCIFDESVPVKLIADLRGKMACCRFAVLKDMRHAMALSENHDTILYLPLFIGELAEFAAKKGREAEIQVPQQLVREDITVKDTTVLVVDDNEINLVVSGEMLRSFEAEVICADSGEKALELCEKQKFDIIFMDHMMPGLDGVETTARIRGERGINGKTPIIALTANVVNDMESYYLRSGMDDFIGKPIDLADIERVLGKWLPPEKIVGRMAPAAMQEGADAIPDSVSQEELLSAMDNFGLYSSDVMREIGGNFETYVKRMDIASQELGILVGKLKKQLREENWDSFEKSCIALRELLYGIGARDCASRARKLAIAAKKRNIDYINEDFYSLMGNMYMLDKKLVVIVPVARGESLEQLPLNVPQFLHGCLDKMGRALRGGDAVEAMVQLETAAAFSLNMELDMALNEIKAGLERGDFKEAINCHTRIFRIYGEKIGKETICGC